jgi:hypothetical protein
MRSPSPALINPQTFVTVPQHSLNEDMDSVVYTEPTKMMARSISITPMTNQKTPKITGGSARNIFTPLQIRESPLSLRVLHQTTNNTT